MLLQLQVPIRPLYCPLSVFVLGSPGHQPNPAFDGDAWVLGEAEG